MNRAKSRKIAIFGADGQLASQIALAAPSPLEIIRAPRTLVDITRADSISEFLAAHRPDLVFNGAAYNAVDRAQGEGAGEALQINAIGVANLAQSCEKWGAKLVHFSTDFVFDGAKNSPYLETDATNPLSIYGASKLCGENMCLSVGEHNLAIRVCRLFGPTPENGAGSARKPGGNFPLLMLRLARERGQVRVVDDQIGAPSYTPDIARATWELVENGASGLFQLCNSGETSFADYAAQVFQIAGLSCEIERVSSLNYGAPARRPPYSTLCTRKAQSAGAAPLRHYREALEEYLKREN